jgi:hypothetical protein
VGFGDGRKGEITPLRGSLSHDEVTMMKSPIFKFFASLKLAVISILLLASVLTIATCLESLYGTRAVHVLVYGTPWFAGVLFLLGVNVLCAALIRYPWKKSQTGFVMTHLGIIILLFGSVVTQKFGVDANMPVSEGTQENEITLNELVLLVVDEAKNIRKEFPIRESYLPNYSKSVSVELNGPEKVLVDGFIPRAVPLTQFAQSPIEGLGMPSLKLELFNSRFNLEESIVVQHPTKPTEVNLGPALITFQVLNSLEEQKKFFSPTSSVKEGPEPGFLVMSLHGKEYRVGILKARKRFVPIGAEYEVQIDDYFPYAVVENNQLVNRSNEPINPAVHLTVRKKGFSNSDSTEKHTIFSNFPEFSTLHGAHSKKNTLGLKFRMEMVKQSNLSLAIVGNQRGRLAFAQTADGSKLFYRTQGKDGQVKAQGEIQPGVTTATGWMDLQFKIHQWLPHSVEQTVPKSIEYISGSGDNYLSAIHLNVVSRETASESSEKTASGWWLFEGQGKLLNVGGRELFIQYTKKRLTLPFYIFLEKFKIGNDPGTMKAASYQSDVMVKDVPNAVDKKANISMNEPLKYGGYTFYQASYSIEEGRPPVSVFSVNFDPGRQIKYWGSLIMVLGILVMFYMNPHYFGLIFTRKRQPK